MYSTQKNADYDRHSVPIYEELARMPPFQRKTMVLVGSDGAGKDSLVSKLLTKDAERLGGCNYITWSLDQPCYKITRWRDLTFCTFRIFGNTILGCTFSGVDELHLTVTASMLSMLRTGSGRCFSQTTLPWSQVGSNSAAKNLGQNYRQMEWRYLWAYIFSDSNATHVQEAPWRGRFRTRILVR